MCGGWEECREERRSQGAKIVNNGCFLKLRSQWWAWAGARKGEELNHIMTSSLPSHLHERIQAKGAGLKSRGSGDTWKKGLTQLSGKDKVSNRATSSTIWTVPLLLIRSAWFFLENYFVFKVYSFLNKKDDVTCS